MENHLHEYSELLYCKRGTEDVFVNGKHIHLTEKDLVWIPPNYIHQYMQTDAELICAVFSNDFIPLFFQITKGKRMIPPPVSFFDMSRILDQFHTLDGKNLLLINGFLNIICARIVKKQDLKKQHRQMVSYIKRLSHTYPLILKRIFL